MGIFKKKKDKKPKAPAAVSTGPRPTSSQPAVQEEYQPSKQVIKIIGDEKHITQERIDVHGQKVVQTQIIKLTDAEKEQFGIPLPLEQSPGPQAPQQDAYQRQQAPANQRKAPPQQERPAAQRRRPPGDADDRGSTTPDELGTQVTNLSFGNESMATIEITRELVKKFISDIWNRGEVEMIPQVCHPSLRFNGHVGMDRVGHEGFERMVTTVREALTDYHCEIHSMVVESNKAFCRLRFTGKHTGNLLGYAPTGKAVSWMGASEFTCKNGKILKVWELGDVKSLEDQLRDSD